MRNYSFIIILTVANHRKQLMTKDNRKYSIIFLGVAFSLFLGSVQLSKTSCIAVFLMRWGAISCLVLSSAYFFGKPLWVMGRTAAGVKCPQWYLLFLFLNLPFLSVCWLVWLVRNVIIRKDAVSQIGETGISISRWPVFDVPLKSYDLVIDMTAEMPKLYRTRDRYILLPNLDGVPLTDWHLPCEIERGTSLLVHCAQGYGRSAVMAGMLLLKLGYVSSGEEAVALLKKYRKDIRLTKEQQEQLYCFQSSGSSLARR